MKKWIWILVSLLVISSGFISFRINRIEVSDAGMLPTLREGKSVWLIKKNAKKLHPGNLVAFYDPSVSDAHIKRKPKRISRLMSMPGDTIRIEKKEIFLNGKLYHNETPVFMKYRLSTKKALQESDLSEFYFYNFEEIVPDMAYELSCTPQTAAKIGRLESVTTVRLLSEFQGNQDIYHYPKSQHIAWNKDNFGPFILPREGVQINLNYRNYSLYERIINVYEGHQSYIKAQKIYIDGEIATTYRFKKNYYFVINDNRDLPTDSRMFGPIPEDHIIGQTK